jgi:pyruvate decarboxylase
MPNAKSFFSEEHPQYIGIYWGGVSNPGCRCIVDWADVILASSPVFSHYTTVGWTGQPPHEHTISAEPRYMRLPEAEYTHVALAESLSAVARNVRANDTTLAQYHRIVRTALAGSRAGTATHRLS